MPRRLGVQGYQLLGTPARARGRPPALTLGKVIHHLKNNQETINYFDICDRRLRKIGRKASLTDAIFVYESME